VLVAVRCRALPCRYHSSSALLAASFPKRTLKCSLAYGHEARQQFTRGLQGAQGVPPVSVGVYPDRAHFDGGIRVSATGCNATTQ
jgi:hypothetical protein